MDYGFLFAINRAQHVPMRTKPKTLNGAAYTGQCSLRAGDEVRQSVFE